MHGAGGLVILLVNPIPSLAVLSLTAINRKVPEGYIGSSASPDG